MPTIADYLAPIEAPSTPEEVLRRVNDLLSDLRARAHFTEKMRKMHPNNLENLTKAGVFRLTMPADVGGFEADDFCTTEVLAQIARGCPSTGFVCTMVLSLNCIPAMLGDDAADEIFSTPDLRIAGTIAPTGHAQPARGGYQVSGQWAWNTAGVHSNWIAATCMTPTTSGVGPMMALIPSSSVRHGDTWFAAGMAGTATTTVSLKDVFVPESRTVPIHDLIGGIFPQRRYSPNPYFNRPWIMWASTLRSACLLGIARGATRNS